MMYHSKNPDFFAKNFSLPLNFWRAFVIYIREKNLTMRKFTKQHNELQWLFPICESEEQASEHFDRVEREAADLLEMCYGDQQTFTRDDMIDAFMKGNSRACRECGWALFQAQQLNKATGRAADICDEIIKELGEQIELYKEQINILEKSIKPSKKSRK